MTIFTLPVLTLLCRNTFSSCHPSRRGFKSCFSDFDLEHDKHPSSYLRVLRIISLMPLCDTMQWTAVVQLLIHVQLFATPWTAAPRYPCLSPSPGICSNLCSLSWWCHPTISSSCHPFLLLLSIFPILLKYFKFLRLDYFLLCILVTCQVEVCGQYSLVDKSEAQESKRFGFGYLGFLPFKSCVAHKLCVVYF